MWMRGGLNRTFAYICFGLVLVLVLVDCCLPFFRFRFVILDSNRTRLHWKGTRKINEMVLRITRGPFIVRFLGFRQPVVFLFHAAEFFTH
jgi:hypothetical protein